MPARAHRLLEVGRALAMWLGALVLLPAQAQLLAFSAEEKARILAHGPWPAAAERDASNRVDGRPAAGQWGRALFFDNRLSADGRSSCASCHQPKQGFQDGKPTPTSASGVVAGASASSRTGQRNTSGLLDTALQRFWGWGGEHDSLWSASLAPLLAAQEMGHTVHSLAQRVRQTPAWERAYRRAFGSGLPSNDTQLAVDVAKALAAYQATLRSPRTAFDDFRDALARGDTRRASRYPQAAQRGLRLFVGSGQCFFCHSGPQFSNGEFADVGVPFFVPGGVDAGRHAGLLALRDSPYTRLGLHTDAQSADARAVFTRHVVLEPRHFGEFKVPSLRQLVHTAPYMHNGSLARLKDVVNHYADLNEERLHADGERILRPLKLDVGQRADLEAFLRSLSR